ncbi:unnamed protein product [Echinostoma caproni]|uniref:DUF1758 domain-containing protein n=1 Tax=Echinostoma caproni TaxID=27848 RepID=A0A183AL27_9TREM|nr:unnamed protein product [Echinostoma caproni]
MCCPNIVDMLPVLKYARNKTDALTRKQVIRYKVPVTNKWLPVNKEKNQDFCLHNEEVFSKVLDDLKLPESGLDAVFADEIRLWKKPDSTTHTRLEEIELFIEEVRSQLEEERKTYSESVLNIVHHFV